VVHILVENRSEPQVASAPKAHQQDLKIVPGVFGEISFILTRIEHLRGTHFASHNPVVWRSWFGRIYAGRNSDVEHETPFEGQERAISTENRPFVNRVA
jgi:hypothetical protein